MRTNFPVDLSGHVPRMQNLKPPYVPNAFCANFHSRHHSLLLLITPPPRLPAEHEHVEGQGCLTQLPQRPRTPSFVEVAPAFPTGRLSVMTQSPLRNWNCDVNHDSSIQPRHLSAGFPELPSFLIYFHSFNQNWLLSFAIKTIIGSCHLQLKLVINEFIPCV